MTGCWRRSRSGGRSWSCGCGSSEAWACPAGTTLIPWAPWRATFPPPGSEESGTWCERDHWLMQESSKKKKKKSIIRQLNKAQLPGDRTEIIVPTEGGLNVLQEETNYCYSWFRIKKILWLHHRTMGDCSLPLCIYQPNGSMCATFVSCLMFCARQVIWFGGKIS